MSPPYVISAVAAFSLLLLLHLAAAGDQPQPPPASASASNSTNATTATARPGRRSYTREFLQAHNKFRSAFQVPPLTWDRNLTRFARRWGEKCAADCKMTHSYGPYGENMFWGKLEHWTPTEVVESWAGEDKFYNLNNNECAAGQMCGHYTQIIWKESLRLGCARVNCANGELLVICEYDPPGNYVNEKPIWVRRRRKSVWMCFKLKSFIYEFFQFLSVIVYRVCVLRCLLRHGLKDPKLFKFLVTIFFAMNEDLESD